MKIKGKRVLAGALALVLAVSSIGEVRMAQAAKANISATRSMTLTVQQSQKIKIKGSNLKKKSFKSSNRAVAVVNDQGKVTAKKEGKCKITITVKYKKNPEKKKLSVKRLTCKVSVVKQKEQDEAAEQAVPGTIPVPDHPVAPVPTDASGNQTVPETTVESGIISTTETEVTAEPKVTSAAEPVETIPMETENAAPAGSAETTPMETENAAPAGSAETTPMETENAVPAGSAETIPTEPKPTVETTAAAIPEITTTPSLEPVSSMDPEQEDWGFVLKSLTYDGTEYPVEKDRNGSDHFMMELYGRDSLRYLLPNLAQASFQADYKGEEVSDIQISKIRWHYTSYYDDNKKCTGYYSFLLTGIWDGEQLQRTISLSDYNDIPYAESLEARETGLAHDIIKADDLYRYSVELAEGESLKNLFQNLTKDYAVYIIYKNKKVEASIIEDIIWHDEPYYSDSTQGGYYSFTAGIKTALGQEIKKSFYLTEVYHPSDDSGANARTFYQVKGIARTADDKLMRNVELTFDPQGDGEQGDYVDTIDTDEQGAYSIELPSGVYRIGISYANTISYTDNFITVGTTDVSQDLKFDSLYEISGKVLDSSGAPVEKGDVELWGEDYLYCSENVSGTGEYYLYLWDGDSWNLSYDNIFVKKVSINGQSVTQDIHLDEYRQVSGTFFISEAITGDYLELIFEDTENSDHNYVYCDKEGKYNIYLKQNTTYQCYAYSSQFGAQIDLGTFRTEENTTKDFQADLHEVSGIVRYADGKKAEHWEHIYLVQGDDSYTAISYPNGNYTCYVPNGTYQVVAECMITLTDTEISVKDQDVTAHLELPYYHVSGTVTNQGAEIGRIGLNLYDEDGGKYLKSFYTNKKGKYSLYLPAGKYMLSSSLNKKSMQSYEVQAKEQVIDLNLGLYHVFGALYAHGTTGMYDPYRSYKLSFYDEQGSRVKNITIQGGKENYSVYLKDKGIYTVKKGDLEVDTITVDAPETKKDLVYNVYKVSGMLYRIKGELWKDQYISFVDTETGNETGDCWSRGNGSYSIYIRPGKYDIKKNGIKIGTVEITDQDVVKNIECNMYSISGISYRIEGVVWKGQHIMLCDENGEVLADRRSDHAKGSFNIYATPGTYQLKVGSYKTVTVTVLDKDITQDIICDVLNISGTLYRAEGIPWANQYFRLTPKDSEVGGTEENGGGQTDAEGRYSVNVSAGSYRIRTLNMELGTINVEGKDVTKDFICSEPIYKVAGTLYQSEGQVWKNQNIQFRVKKTQSENAAVGQGFSGYANSTGKYQTYLYAGTYEIFVNGILMDTIEITDQDISRDIVNSKKLYTVSGTIYRMQDTPWGNYTCYLYEKNADGTLSQQPTYFHADQNGKYSMQLPAGKYVIKTQNNMITAVDELEVTDQNITKDIVCNYYNITGTLYRSEGVAWSNAKIYISSKSNAGDGRQYITTDQYGKYQVFLTAGDYNVSICGNQIGNITVTNQDVVQDIVNHEELYQISGTLYQTENKKFAKKTIVFQKENNEGGTTTSYYNETSDQNGNYSIYLTQGSYRISVDRNQIGTMEVTGQDSNRDIVCNLHKLTGTLVGIEASMANFAIKNSEGVYCGILYCTNSKYTMYLKNGNYKAYYNNKEIDAFEIAGEEDIEKDFIYNAE